MGEGKLICMDQNLRSDESGRNDDRRMEVPLG
jgi:hypothetical protein